MADADRQLDADELASGELTREDDSPPLSEEEAAELTPAEQVLKAHVAAAEAAEKDHELTTPVATYGAGPAYVPDPTEGKTDEEVADLARQGLGGAKVRQKAGASDESAAYPLHQRPAEEQAHLADYQRGTKQTGDTKPGERALENDEPAFQVAVTHVPGTPLPQTAEDAGNSAALAEIAALEPAFVTAAGATERSRYDATLAKHAALAETEAAENSDVLDSDHE